jgi:hypothetical protein
MYIHHPFEYPCQFLKGNIMNTFYLELVKDVISFSQQDWFKWEPIIDFGRATQYICLN